jgi:hypothetical protein
MKLLPLLLLLPLAAHGQGLTTLAPGATGGGKVLWSAPFSTAGCYASGQTAGASSAIAITRATNATYVDGNGDVQTCTTGQFRVAPDGLLVEPARTQYALQSATHPKAAEATGTVPTGACVAWHDGTGTMTLAAGTATVTGLSCTTVAAGTLCPFTVTLTGTMALTTTAGTTHAQVECTGSYRTSRIVTTTTALARNADVVSATVPAVPSKWCIAVTAKPGSGTAWTIYPNLSYIWTLGSISGANSAGVGFLAPSRTFLDHYSSVPTERYVASGATPSAGANRFIGCSIAGDLNLSVAGVNYGTDSGAGSGTFGTSPTTFYFNPSVGGVQVATFLKDLRMYKISKSASEAK